MGTLESSSSRESPAADPELASTFLLFRPTGSISSPSSLNIEYHTGMGATGHGMNIMLKYEDGLNSQFSM